MTLKDSEEILEQLRLTSRFSQPTNVNTATVDRLIDSHWCSKEDLVLAYSDLQNPDLDRAAVLFQLPFSMRLPDKWLKVRSEYGNPYIRFRSVPISRSLATDFTPDPRESPNLTQVLMSYQLWERRRQLYGPYLEALAEPRQV